MTNNKTNQNQNKKDNGLQTDKLNKALLRTFRGDITKEVGKDAPKIVEKLVPGLDSNTSGFIKEGEEKTKNTTQIKIEKVRKARPDSLLHTYKGDVQELVKRRKLSLMRMAAAEADRKGGAKYKINIQSSSATPGILTVTALLLLLVGTVALIGAYYTYIARKEMVSTAQPIHHSIIFSEGQETVDVTNKKPRALKQLLAQIRNGQYYSFGSIIELILIRTNNSFDNKPNTSSALTTDELFESFNINVGKNFTKVFAPTFMLGLHAMEKNTPFLILKTKDYESAFAGMLIWESVIERDLAPLFSPNGKYAKPAVLSGNNIFTDTIIENADVRILRDGDDNVRILYSFVNPHTLVITTNVQTFKLLVQRLRVAK